MNQSMMQTSFGLSLDELEASLSVIDHTSSMINAALQGMPLPGKASANDVEMSIERSAQVFVDEIGNSAIGQVADALAKLESIKIDQNAASNVESLACLHTEQLTHEFHQIAAQAHALLQEKGNELRSWRAAHGIFRSARVKPKWPVFQLTVSIFVFEGVINAGALFASSALPGGIAGALAVAFGVGLFNTGFGYLIGEHLYREFMS